MLLEQVGIVLTDDAVQVVLGADDSDGRRLSLAVLVDVFEPLSVEVFESRKLVDRVAQQDVREALVMSDEVRRAHIPRQVHKVKLEKGAIDLKWRRQAHCISKVCPFRLRLVMLSLFLDESIYQGGFADGDVTNDKHRGLAIHDW